MFEASDGVQAVDLARALRPDLVVLDLGLSRLSACDAARIMRCDRRLHIRSIVALTESEDVGVPLAESGFSGQIEKPVVLRSLRRQLQAISDQVH